MTDKKMFPDIKGKIIFREPLRVHTTFHIGGPCDIWAEPQREKDLKIILAFAKATRKKLFVIGRGSNVLFSDRGFGGIVVRLGSTAFKKMHISGSRIVAGAGACLGSLVNFACRNGLAGIEGLVGIPGTLGGAIFMNSSYKGAISDYIEKIRVMRKDSGNIEIIPGKDIPFGYRHSGLDRYIILEATLKLKNENKNLLMRKKNKYYKMKKGEQPLECRTAGCVFKNPNRKFSAARYIDALRFKGTRIGDAKVSEKHANFIVNMKSAKSTDVTRLMNAIKKRVKSRYHVSLTPEIKLL